jgi:hypothetical protein
MNKFGVLAGKIAIVILLIIPLSVWSGCKHKKPRKGTCFMDNYQGPTVTISGKIIFPNYNGERFRISAIKPLVQRPQDTVSSMQVFRPGEYSIKVPQDIGDVNIRVIALKPGQNFNDGTRPEEGRYENNPLKVGRYDIKGIDITVKRHHILLMDNYQGPTVTISGKIIFPNYNGERFRIGARSHPSKFPEDIALEEIYHPGGYFLKVPQNIGDVYIRGMFLRPGELRTAKYSTKEYNEGRPIKVETSDIRGVDIRF